MSCVSVMTMISQSCAVTHSMLLTCVVVTQVGASFGGMVGLNLLMWLPESWNIQPGVYAVVAATAVLAGVFRSSISLVSSVHSHNACRGVAKWSVAVMKSGHEASYGG